MLLFKYLQIKLRPGQEQDLKLTGLDQFGNPTFFITRIIDKDESLGSTLSDNLIVSESFEPPDNYSLLYFRNEVRMYNYICNIYIYIYIFLPCL